MSYDSATFFVDDGLVSGTPGSDAARSTISAVAFDNPSSSLVRGTKAAHGLLTGMVVTISGTTNWDGLWKVTRVDANTFTLDGAVWVSGADNTGDVVPAGGSSWADAWLTPKRGGAMTSIASGCEIRHARSPAPVSIGDAQWTSGVAEENKRATVLTNATPIVATVTSHNFVNGDWVFIEVFNPGTNTGANGLWRVANKTTHTFELEGSVGNGVGSGDDNVRKVTSSVVYLDAAQTAKVHDCDTGLVARTGLVFRYDPYGSGADAIIISDPGTGYTLDDVLTITGGGGTGATLKVTNVGGGGEVNQVEVLTHGKNYTGGSGYATTGGTGGGTCEVDLVALGTVDVGSGDYHKHGVDSFRVNRITQVAGTEHAYAPTTGIFNLSAYQKLSFQAGVALIGDAGQGSADDDWEVCLCSDVAGATVVDVFKVPGIDNTTAYARLRPFTVTREGGGNLGASIRSVLVRNGTSTFSTLTKLTLDNLVACTTNGLSLQSLITKNAAEQGGAEPCYAIQGIYGRAVMIDLDPAAGPSDSIQSWAPYYGTTEHVATYKREAIKCRYSISSSQAVDLGNTSGTEALPCTVSGGWNVSTGLRTGETLYDGLSGEGNGIDCGGQRWTTTEGFGVYRFNVGFTTSYDIANPACTYDISAASHCFEDGISLAGYNSAFSVRNARNNRSSGLKLEGAARCRITDSVLVGNQTNLEIGSYSHRNSFHGLSVLAARNIGIQGSGWDNAIHGLVSADNDDYVLHMIDGRLLFYDFVEADVADMATFFYPGFGGLDPVVHSFNHNGSGQDRLWFEQASGRSLPTSRPGGSGRMWEAALDGTFYFFREGAYPVRYESVHAVAVKANKEVTLKAWMQKNSAANVRGRLVVRGGQLAGVPNDVVATLAGNTDWQELEVAFTPTEAGWIEADVWADVVSGTGAVNVDDVSSTQEA